jgi:hypothetical protein
MEPVPVQRSRAYVGPVILICVGVFFLVVNLVPSFNPWTLLFRYWPVILIIIGLGKMWDYYAMRRHPDVQASSGVSGVVIAVVVLVLLLVVMTWRRDRNLTRNQHEIAQSVELQGANDVAATLQFPAGQLDVRGGSAHLVDASFRYNDGDTTPQLDYKVASGHGELTIHEPNEAVHFGGTDDRWQLAFNDAVPLDLTLQMGAGQSDMKLADLNLTHLQVHLGAGQVLLDLTGQRKQNLSAEVQGGVGQARIRLPKDIGVRAHASGGIGAINVHGLSNKGGDEYENDAYGKTPVSIELEVHGGIGEVDLDQE